MNRLTKIKFSIFLFLSISTLSCSQDTKNSESGSKNLRQCYFQIADFKSPKIYKFVDANNPQNIHLWKMYYKVDKQDTIFFTESLDEQYRAVDVLKELITKDDTKMLDYYFINYDAGGKAIKVPCKVIENELFSFVSQKHNLIWSIKYQGRSEQEMLKKERVFITKNIMQKVSEKEHQCAKFRDNYSIKLLSSGDTYTFFQDSYYAKNVGLIRYERTLPSGEILDYQLVDIIEE